MARRSVSMRRARALLGTIVDISAEGAAHARLEAAIEHAFERIDAIQRLLSVHEPRSEISRINKSRSAEQFHVNPCTHWILTWVERLWRESGGVFDPTIAAGGISTMHNLQLLGRNEVRLGGPVRLDLGGIAKGFAVDEAVQVLIKNGVSSGLVNAGGDMRAFGGVYGIVLRAPSAPQCCQWKINLRDAALATSATYFAEPPTSERRRRHLVDPVSKRELRSPCSVTVKAPTCLLADALTKVALFGGRRAHLILKKWGAEMVVVGVEGAHETFLAA